MKLKPLIQPARRAVQLAVILLILFFTFFSMFGLLKKYGLLIRTETRFFQAIYYTFDAAARKIFESYDEVLTASSVVKGSTWVISIGELKLADPLAMLSFALASREIFTPLLLAAALPLLFTLLFGRAFCGWLCPMNTLLEGIDALRMRVAFLDVSFSRRAKYYILALVLLLALFGLPVVHLIYPPLIISREIYGYVYYASLGSGAAIIFAIAAFEFFVSRRAWCRYFCPGGALLSLLGAKSLVRIKRNEAKCDSRACSECIEACMLALNPRGEINECTNCGVCIVHCPHEALDYSLNLPRPATSKN